MKSKLYFSDLKATTKRNLFNKLEELLEKVEIKSRIKLHRPVAIKLHYAQELGLGQRDYELIKI